MRVFVTGATGFIGRRVADELMEAGHEIIGLARSAAAVQSLTDAGIAVQQGSLEDLDSLRAGAAAADAVLHLGFNHDFSKFQENCEIDAQAIKAMGEAIANSGKLLIVTAGAAGLALNGKIRTEDDAAFADASVPRVSEQTALGLAAMGVRASVIRLPQVHDRTKQGLVSFMIAIAQQKGMSAYVGEGSNRWAAAHVSDVARLYRLALEKNEAGAIYHAVGEEGVRMRDIAEVIGRGLGVPVQSIALDMVHTHFGWLGIFAGHDLQASSIKTQRKLGWTPVGPTLLADLEQMRYS